MKFCQVSTFLLTIALSHLTYAAPATTNSVLGSSEAKGIIKINILLFLIRMWVLLTSLHKVLLNNMAGGYYRPMMLYLKGFAIYLPDVAGTAFVEAMKKIRKSFQLKMTQS